MTTLQTQIISSWAIVIVIFAVLAVGSIVHSFGGWKSVAEVFAGAVIKLSFYTAVAASVYFLIRG